MAELFAAISGVSKNMQDLTNQVSNIEQNLKTVNARLVVLETNDKDEQTLAKKDEAKVDELFDDCVQEHTATEAQFATLAEHDDVLLQKAEETATELNAMKEAVGENFVSKAEYQQLVAEISQLKTDMRNDIMLDKDPSLGFELMFVFSLFFLICALIVLYR